MLEWSMFGHSWVRLTGIALASPGDVAEAIRHLVVSQGGQVEGAGGNVGIYRIAAHRVMGVGFKFGTWYGATALKLRIVVNPSDGGQISHCEIECDLAGVRRRFRVFYFAISGIVLVLFLRAIVFGGQEMSAGWLVVLALPYVIFEGNFLSFRAYLPSRLRRFFAEVLT